MSAFVDYLVEHRHDVPVMGALRRLFSGSGITFTAAAAPHVLPFVDDDGDLDSYLLVAALAPDGPKHQTGQSIAHACRAIVASLPVGAETSSGASGGKVYEREFNALLDAPRTDLPRRLRHLVALCAQHREPFDWDRLLADLREWDAEDRHVQTRLAREMWM